MSSSGVLAVTDRADRKMRFAGLLENPYVSMAQRNILDYGRRQGLSKTIQALEVKRVLDIGCGLGENSRLYPSGYVGLDNSFPRVRFAAEHYRASRFFLADALKFPVKEKSFDLVMLIDTSHHLTDEQFLNILSQMQRASRRWVLVSDPVFFKGQSALSRFFYKLDRGAVFREPGHLHKLFLSRSGLVLEKEDYFMTFPGLYCHGAFLLRVSR